jgi:hypothetical protein
MQLSGPRFTRALLVPTFAWFLKKYAPGSAKLTSPLWSGQKAARRTRLREFLIFWLGSSLRTLEIDAEFARIGDLDVIDLLVSDISDERYKGFALTRTSPGITTRSQILGQIFFHLSCSFKGHRT